LSEWKKINKHQLRKTSGLSPQGNSPKHYILWAPRVFCLNSGLGKQAEVISVKERKEKQTI